MECGKKYNIIVHLSIYFLFIVKQDKYKNNK